MALLLLSPSFTTKKIKFLLCLSAGLGMCVSLTRDDLYMCPYSFNRVHTGALPHGLRFMLVNFAMSRNW
jgi:hypothetical protein